MTQSVNVIGFGILNFPDGMSQADMAAAIQKNFPQIHNPANTKIPGYQASDTGQFTPISAGVQQAQTTTPYEKFAVPVGAALSDTGRSIGHLMRLIAGSQSPGMMPAALTANAADQADTEKQEQPARDAAAQQNPSTYYGLYAPTSLLSMAPLGEGIGGAATKLTAGLSGSANLLPRVVGFMGRSSLTGAGYGAQMPGDTGTNLLTGAALGPLGEGTIKGLPLAYALSKKAGSGIADITRQIVNPAQEAQNTVQKIVQESSTGTSLLQPSFVPGVNLTAGGQSLNPGLQNLEQVIRSRNIGGVANEAVAQAQQRQNNSVIRGMFGQIAATDAPLQTTSTAASDALNDAQDARRATEKDLWSQVPMDAQVDATKTTSALDGYINKQTVSDQRLIQRIAGDFLDDFKAAAAKYADQDAEQVKMPFSEIKSLRSSLGDAIRAASDKYGSGSNAVRLLKGMDDKLLGTLGDENALLGAPEPTGNAALDSANTKLANMNGTVTSQQLGDTYNAARRFTAETHGNYFTKNVQGFMNQDPAKMLDAVTKTPENMKAYLNAVSQAPDGGAKGIQALRDYLLSKGIGSASMSARGGTEKFLNGQTLKNWLQSNQGVLSHVFSGDELDQMGQLSDAAYRNIATEAATPRVGSNTLQKFIGNQNIPGLPGKLGSVANSIRDTLVGNYRGKTEQLLRDALFDPQNKGLQQMLDQPMTQENMSKLVQFMNKTPALKAKVPLLFNASLRIPQVAATRYLTNPAQQGTP